MILETAGIALIIPFVQALVSVELNQQLIELLNIFNIYPSSKFNLIIILMLILAFTYTLKVSFLTYFSYAQLKLLTETRVSLSNRLYHTYLNKPFGFHLNNHSSKFRTKLMVFENFKKGAQVIFFPIPPLDISSKNIRQRIIKKEEIKNLLPLSVDHYIMKHQLYRNDSPPKVA